MRDGLFAARMAYCGPRGIALSAFLAWDEGDQEAALAWQRHENDRCPGCGSHPDEGPKHFHVNVCSTCVELEKTRKSEDAQVRGAHVVARDGTAGTCDRCLGEIRANSQPTGR